jgi:4-nitrophenyl phosphatase
VTRVAGIVLAAGASTRFGSPKQLLMWDGTPLAAHVCDVALAARLDPVIAVLGHSAADVRRTLVGRPVQVAMNWRWKDGLSTSVQTGLAALPPDVEGAIFLHCDQPLITARLLQAMVDHFDPDTAPIVHPTVQGERAAPVLFARDFFAEMANVHGDRGGRGLINKYADRVATITVDDPNALVDVDTPEAFKRITDSRSQNADCDLESAISNLIIDMDGVLWRGETPMPGLKDFFAFLRERCINFILATNNASRRPDQYVEKLARFGVDVPQRAILTAAQATAAYLASVAPPRAPVHFIGADGLRDALTERGFELVNDGARYVVVGWTKELTWEMLAQATIQIRAGAEFIGTNPDVTFPSERGLVPGNGSTLAAIQAATNTPPRIIGKPEPWLYQEAMRRMDAQASATAVIGDRLDTDIAGGLRASIRTILLFSGITTPEELTHSPIAPDMTFANITELTEAWKKCASR